MDDPVSMQEVEVLETFRLLGLADEETRLRLRQLATQPKTATQDTYTAGSTSAVLPAED
jgi:hypothetical protein